MVKRFRNVSVFGPDRGFLYRYLRAASAHSGCVLLPNGVQTRTYNLIAIAESRSCNSRSDLLLQPDRFEER